jgi:hypothetical protein
MSDVLKCLTGPKSKCLTSGKSRRLLATGSNDKMVQLTRVTQTEAGALSHTAPVVLAGHTGTVRCVTWCERVGPGTQFACFNGTKVQILTQCKFVLLYH